MTTPSKTNRRQFVGGVAAGSAALMLGKSERAAGTNKSKNKYVGPKEAWAGAYGDPDDPLVQAQIEATARWLTDGSINS
tara:strand:+ start:75 stop:311 length:237 start_codon:yes stop_codon:yes gene_type:complete